MASAIRIGLINEMSDGPPAVTDIEAWLRREVDELVACGRIDRPVEFVSSWGLGLPMGTAAAVERGFRELVDRDVLMIVGPAIGDNALVATPLADRHRMPTINWAGAERARSDYMFHLQVGSHEDESIVIARHLAAAGATRAGVVFDESQIGRRHVGYLEDEARRIGLRIAASVSIKPLAEQAEAPVSELLDGRVDAIVYLGLGLSAPAVASSLRARGWSGLTVMNTAGLRGYDETFARKIDGWHYVDMHSDNNGTLASLRDRLSIPPQRALSAAKGHDLGRLVAEGIARAPELTRDGLRAGLEQVKWIPAAEGHDGTLLGFGVQDRGALHGRYLVLRQWRDGRSAQIG
ncbi:ABC transporter substrate-binding protein [Novosphingobium sp. BL-8A]|uniref:ABC transporter substrate-binding protein n=1 Tax=Novosphingobium sp. BL-8A TaxID=3127639 RepID=UPI003756FA9C